MAQNYIEVLILVIMLAISTPLLGSYMAKMFQNEKAPGDRFFKPVERLVFRITGVNPEGEQRWTVYAISVLAFSLVSVIVLYGMQRLQAHLPFNPDHLGTVSAPLSFNTAASFLTNTNWQNYAGEDTMSQFTQMAGLVVEMFTSAAAGIAVAVALIRGLTRNKTNTLGNFWVDLVRIITRILFPIAIIGAIIFIAQGAEQSLHASHAITTLTGQTQNIPGDPIASQEAIKQLGTNGGGYIERQRRPPLREPDRPDQHREQLAAALHPVRPGLDVRQDGQGPQAGPRRPRCHGRPVGHRRSPGHAARGQRQHPHRPGPRHPDGE